MSALFGKIQHIFENVIIRHFEADGTRSNSMGNVVGDPRVFRAMLGMAEVNKDEGKNQLAQANVFVHPTISGIRLKPSVVAAFEKEHKRQPQQGDRISFTSNGDICAPVDRRIGNGQYVVKTPESEELSPGTKDCVLEYTGITDVKITPADDSQYDTVAVDTAVDVEDLPW